jgi:hypothetical protein
MELFLAFVAGMIIMDAMWAWRLGIPQAIWAQFKLKQEQKRSARESSQ